MSRIFKSKATGKSQADGAFEISMLGYETQTEIAIQIVPSSTPSAGVMTVGVKIPGATAFVDLDETFDMTSADLLKIIDNVSVEALRFTPASFDAGKTYSVYVAAHGQGLVP